MKLNLVVYGLLLVVVASDALAQVDRGADDGTREISRLVTKYAKEYKIERDVLSCVLKVESGYRMGLVSETEDYGMSQINAKTARMYGFSLVELLSNVDYSIKASAIVLADFRKQFRRDEIVNWVGRYNIGYQSLTKTGIGEAYQTYNAKVWKCRKGGDYL